MESAPEDRPITVGGLVALLIWTLALLAALGLGSEALVRRHGGDGWPLPSLDSGLREVDRKVQAFERYQGERDVARRCVVLGSSAVARGISPELVDRAFERHTGAPLDCYNFGIRGLDTETAVLLARVLAADYGVELLLFGLNPRDVVRDLPMDEVLRQGSWYRHHTGRPTPKGWLVERSIAFRYLLWLAEWLEPRPDKPRPQIIDPSLTATGQMQAWRAYADVPPRPLVLAFADFDRQLATWQGRLERLFDDLATKRDENGRPIVVVFEMPPQTLDGIADSERHHAAFLDTLERVTAAAGVELVPLSEALDLPAEVWADYGHLNRRGAGRFSAWLGRNLGRRAASLGLLEDGG